MGNYIIGETEFTIFNEYFPFFLSLLINNRFVKPEITIFSYDLSLSCALYPSSKSKKKIGSISITQKH